MKSLACSVLVFVCVGAAGLARAGSAGGAPQDGYWTCETKESESTIYASGAFEAKSTVNAMDKAFADALKAKYGYTGSVFCGMAFKARTTLDAIKADQHRTIMQQRGNGKTVIETGWVFSTAE
jgi:hypothetical protein